jgi:hypothetical protein
MRQQKFAIAVTASMFLMTGKVFWQGHPDDDDLSRRGRTVLCSTINGHRR